MQLGLTCIRTALLICQHPLWGLQGMKGWLPWRAVKPIHLDNPPQEMDSSRTGYSLAFEEHAEMPPSSAHNRQTHDTAHGLTYGSAQR